MPRAHHRAIQWLDRRFHRRPNSIDKLLTTTTMNVENPNQIRSRHKRIVFIPNQPIEPVAIGSGDHSTTHFRFEAYTRRDFDVRSNRQTMESTPVPHPMPITTLTAPPKVPLPCVAGRNSRVGPSHLSPNSAGPWLQWAPVHPWETGRIGPRRYFAFAKIGTARAAHPSPVPYRSRKPTSTAIYPDKYSLILHYCTA